MFRIYDGRDVFYQWDSGRKLIIEDNSINEVHYCNRTDECSLVVEVYELEGLRVADVPNVLLQTAWPINVYGYDSKYTKHSTAFKVIQRTKPADYVYTETEVLNYNTLLERIDSVEENVGETVENYLKENPIDVDLTGYATEAYVDEKLKDVDVDLTGYATEEYVNNAISNIDIPSGGGEECCVYVGPEAPTDPSKTLWVDTDAEAPEYALKSDIPTVPTKVSAFTNDAGYLTEHQSLEGYATEKYVDDAISSIEGGGGSGSGTARVAFLMFDDWWKATAETITELNNYYQYWREHGEKPEVIFIVPTNGRDMNGNYSVINNIIITESLFNLGIHGMNGRVDTALINNEITDACCYGFSSEVPTTKEWRWYYANESEYIDLYSITGHHLKVYFYMGDTSDSYCLDVSTSYDNNFHEESYTKYYTLNIYSGGPWYFWNEDGRLYLKDSNGDNIFGNSGTLIGWYEWAE